MASVISAALLAKEEEKPRCHKDDAAFVGDFSETGKSAWVSFMRILLIRMKMSIGSTEHCKPWEGKSCVTEM